PPTMRGVLRPKIYYAAQVSMQPPTIVLICNQPRAFQAQYQRYLLSILRDNLSFGEVPIKMYLQKRRRDDKRDELGAGEDTAAEAGAMGEGVGENDEDSEIASEDTGGQE